MLEEAIDELGFLAAESQAAALAQGLELRHGHLGELGASVGDGVLGEVAAA